MMRGMLFFTLGLIVGRYVLGEYAITEDQKRIKKRLSGFLNTEVEGFVDKREINQKADSIIER